jgi:hydrogenase expression/formation protein HypC
MCLSVPAEVISIKDEMAEVSVGGTVFSIGLQLIENVGIGDYVLIHSGFAIQKINKEEADEIKDLLNQISEKS